MAEVWFAAHLLALLLCINPKDAEDERKPLSLETVLRQELVDLSFALPMFVPVGLPSALGQAGLHDSLQAWKSCCAFVVPCFHGVSLFRHGNYAVPAWQPPGIEMTVCQLTRPLASREGSVLSKLAGMEIMLCFPGQPAYEGHMHHGLHLPQAGLHGSLQAWTSCCAFLVNQHKRDTFMYMANTCFQMHTMGILHCHHLDQRHVLLNQNGPLDRPHAHQSLYCCCLSAALHPELALRAPELGAETCGGAYSSICQEVSAREPFASISGSHAFAPTATWFLGPGGIVEEYDAPNGELSARLKLPYNAPKPRIAKKVLRPSERAAADKAAAGSK
eukprot:1148771-Pelagomonas_calceolata.AAC.9